VDRLCAAPPDAPRYTLGSILRKFLPALELTLGLGGAGAVYSGGWPVAAPANRAPTFSKARTVTSSIGPAVPAATAIALNASPPRVASGSTTKSAVCCPTRRR
jgi:hypothetical protein